RFRKLGDLRVRKFRRADKRNDGVRFGVILNRAHETAARESGAQSVLSLVLCIQLMLFDLIITKFLEGGAECLELRLEFWLRAGGNGDEDEATLGPNQLDGLLGHHFTHATVQTDIMLRRLEFAVVNPGGGAGDNKQGSDRDEGVFFSRRHRDRWSVPKRYGFDVEVSGKRHWMLPAFRECTLGMRKVSKEAALLSKNKTFERVFLLWRALIRSSLP